MSKETKVENPLHKNRNIEIYCLSIRRLPDKRMYFYAYYDNVDVLMYSAFRLSWHLAARYPIETYKGSQYAIDLFYKLEKPEQHMINSLLYIRYAQDYRTRLIEHLDDQPIERIYKPIPAHFFQFPQKYIWGVIIFLNMIAINDNYGYEVNYQHKSILKNYFDNKEEPLPIDKIDELLDNSLY